MASQFFDLVGFLQPCLLMAKIIVQRVCEDVTSWDVEIGEDNQAELKNCLSATPCTQTSSFRTVVLGWQWLYLSSSKRFLKQEQWVWV